MLLFFGGTSHKTTPFFFFEGKTTRIFRLLLTNHIEIYAIGNLEYVVKNKGLFCVN